MVDSKTYRVSFVDAVSGTIALVGAMREHWIALQVGAWPCQLPCWCDGGCWCDGVMVAGR